MASKKQLQKWRVVLPYPLEDCSPSQWESQGGRNNLDHGASQKSENASVSFFYPVLAPAHGMVLTTFGAFPPCSVTLWKQPPRYFILNLLLLVYMHVRECVPVCMNMCVWARVCVCVLVCVCKPQDKFVKSVLSFQLFIDFENWT